MPICDHVQVQAASEGYRSILSGNAVQSGYVGTLQQIHCTSTHDAHTSNQAKGCCSGNVPNSSGRGIVEGSASLKLATQINQLSSRSIKVADAAWHASRWSSGCARRQVRAEMSQLIAASRSVNHAH